MTAPNHDYRPRWLAGWLALHLSESDNTVAHTLLGEVDSPPLMTATCDTVPEVGADTVVSIFIADMTTRACGRRDVQGQPVGPLD